jgi:galactose mutarotase-like enzyme
MMRYKSWTLTDVANDVWLDSFTGSNDSLRLPTAQDWSIRKRTLRGGMRDGIDLIEVHNGALTYEILPTRGMGLWHGEYRGNFLGWRSPVQGPVHPKFVQLADRGGLGWLTGFDEWLCRCGLASNGPPGIDPSFGPLTLHGRIANLPAHFVEVSINLDPPNELCVTGQVDETGLFYPNLRLTAAYTTIPGSNRLTIHDVVENRSAQPAEIEMLYHCNVGPPFLEAGSRVTAPIREMAPLTPRAAEGIATFDGFVGPTPGFAEQVYVHELVPDAHGQTLAMLWNARADRGLVLRWNQRELPCFTVWKNSGAAEDGYVAGLEPALNYPNAKDFERRQGRVKVLPPGGKWECCWSIEIHDTAASVTSVLKEIATLQAHARAVIHRAPQPRFSAL